MLQCNLQEVRVVLLSNNFILKYYIMRLYCSIYRIIVVNKNGISFSLCILTQSWARWSSDSVKHGAVSAAVDCCLLQAGFYWNEEKGNILLAESVCAQYFQLSFCLQIFYFPVSFKINFRSILAPFLSLSRGLPYIYQVLCFLPSNVV